MPTIIEIARAYILRGEAYSAVQEHFTEGGLKDYDDGQKCMDRIKAIPAADVVEVVHARPVKFYCDALTGRMFTTCSACDRKIGPHDSFCKHCGAKMDGGQEE